MRLADLSKHISSSPAPAVPVPTSEPGREVALESAPVERAAVSTKEAPAVEPKPIKSGGLDPLLTELIESAERVREPQVNKPALEPTLKAKPLKRWGFVVGGLAALVGVLALARGGGPDIPTAPAPGVTRMPPMGGGPSGYIF